MSAGIAVGRPSLGNVLRGEWAKVRTLRSMWYLALGTLMVGVGFSVLLSFAAARKYLAEAPADRLGFDPTSASTSGMIMAQLIVGVLGALVVTNEYATGMIRPSLAAVPVRGRLLAGKAVVVAAVALVLGEVLGFVSFLAGQAVLARRGVPAATLGQPGVLRAVLGCGPYLAAIGLLGAALGAMLRATAGSVALIVAVAVLVPAFTPVLPESWAERAMRYWPVDAGQQLMKVYRDPHLLGPWSGYGVLAAAVAAAMAGALALLLRRDA